MSRTIVLLLAVLVSASHAATAPTDDGGRRRFIAGGPDRLALVGDRRLPRRHHRAESSVGAYVDVDQLVDSTWLAHEVEGYAHRFLCEPNTDCRRMVRRFGGGAVIYLVSAGRGEMLWTSGRHAVRLGWRRVVSTATGTMTVEQPPADVLAEALRTWPTDLPTTSLDGDRRQIWAENERDRQLYYLEDALRLVESEASAQAPRHFVRAALQALVASGDLTASVDDPAAVVAARRWVAEQRAARLAARRCDATPWCALPSIDESPAVARR
jgi:hypothetical protein